MRGRSETRRKQQASRQSWATSVTPKKKRALGEVKDEGGWEKERSIDKPRASKRGRASERANKKC